jgi:hypothetical protein
MALDYEVDPSGADDVYLVTAGTETVTLEDETIKREASAEATQNPPEPEPMMIGDRKKPELVVTKSFGVTTAEIREHWERHAPARVKGLISAKAK